MTNKEKEKKKKNIVERYVDWGLNWRMKPFKALAKMLRKE
jgi:hypothetical protein